jgi:hypothetical protein
MNQGNHWPLGSRFMGPEEVTAQFAKGAGSLDAFAMTSQATKTETAFERLSNELRSNKMAPTRESRPINWLGRP